MFYALSKILYYVLMPAGLLTLVWLAALLTRSTLRRRRLLWLAFAIWYVFANGFLSNELARWWEYAPVTLAAPKQPRVGVVLTGGITRPDVEPFNRVYLGDQADRLGQALLLYKAGQIRKILISGGMASLLARRQTDEGQMARRFLLAAGVPENDILLENKSRNTEENARFSVPILKRQFAGYSVVLITSASHMRRAVGCFRKKNISVTAYPAAFMAQQRQFGLDQWLPSEHALLDSFYLVREMVGYGVYKMMGYL